MKIKTERNGEVKEVKRLEIEIDGNKITIEHKFENEVSVMNNSIYEKTMVLKPCTGNVFEIRFVK